MTNDTFDNNGFVTGYIKTTVKLEGLLILIASSLVYTELGYSWKMFCILFFLPDISLAGYLLGKRCGAITYNIFHSYISPITLAIITYKIEYYQMNYVILIWIAHIGFDRCLGFGLKYASGFRYTHLGFVGKQEIT